jgi:hypothetical protein
VVEYRHDDFSSRLGDRHAREDPLGAVCWDGAPTWFNRFSAQFQVRARSRLRRRTRWLDD